MANKVPEQQGQATAVPWWLVTVYEEQQVVGHVHVEASGEREAEAQGRSFFEQSYPSRNLTAKAKPLKPQEMLWWFVTVYADSDTEGSEKLGSVELQAPTEKQAETLALAEIWNPDSAGGWKPSPRCVVQRSSLRTNPKALFEAEMMLLESVTNALRRFHRHTGIRISKLGLDKVEYDEFDGQVESVPVRVEYADQPHPEIQFARNRA
jgi:hypothetical protein